MEETFQPWPRAMPFNLPLGRRQRRSAEIRERLFRAALALFDEKGFAETTVEDITNAADVGKGTFFNYFPSKEHIFLAFAEMQVGKLSAYVQEVRDSRQPMKTILRNLSAKMIAEPGRSPAVVRMILQANLASEPVRLSMLNFHQRANAALGQLLRMGQQRGEIRDDLPANELALVVRQSMFGNVLLWSLAPETPLQQRLDQVLEVLWNGLGPRHSGRGRSVRTVKG
jgi:AcrR family transcriptional regulator